MASGRIRRSIALWLPVAGATTVLAFALYGGVQQVQRSDADDPQLQMVRDAAAALTAGTAPAEVASGPTVDVATSLAPWLTIYDGDGAAIASTGSYHGDPPQIPDQARADAEGGERSFSWEPVDGLRFATVVEAYPGGTVVAARSLAEVEARESRTLAIGVGAWLAALAAAFIGALAGTWLREDARPAD